MNSRNYARTPSTRRLARSLGIAVVAALTLASCATSSGEARSTIAPAATEGTDASDSAVVSTEAVETSGDVMPDVMCIDLQSAQDLIQATTDTFWVDSRDATGDDRMQIVDSNWQVVGQTPAAGEPIGEDSPMLDVVKFGEPAPQCGGSSDTGGGGSSSGYTMPDVMCLDLQSAQDLIQASSDIFWIDSYDATGQDRMQIVDSNWQVVDQTPAAGTPLSGQTPLLGVVKFGEPSGVCG